MTTSRAAAKSSGSCSPTVLLVASHRSTCKPNEITAAQAGEFHGRWTPRKWADPASDLVVFEQLLYLRQPGYGTSYITGKVLLDRLISDYSSELESEGKSFDLSGFFKHFNAAGILPYPLIEREMVRSPRHMGMPVMTEGDR